MVDTAERLRIVGQWLDLEAAQTVRIELDPAECQVSCLNGNDEPRMISFNTRAFEMVQQTARMLRGQPYGSMRDEWACSLRSVGQDLDEQGITAWRLWTTGDGLMLEGEQADRVVQRGYSARELRARDAQCRSARVVHLLRQQLGERSHWPTRWPVAQRWLPRPGANPSVA